MEVKFEIDAFPSREYGVLTGHIRKISKEATFLQEQGSLLRLLEMKL